MATVTHETENAIFQFDLADAIKGLSSYVIQHRVNEVNDLLDFLTSSPTDPVRIPEERSELFGYIALDLLSQRKGSAYCKICQKAYQAVSADGAATPPLNCILQISPTYLYFSLL